MSSINKMIAQSEATYKRLTGKVHPASAASRKTPAPPPKKSPPKGRGR